MESSAADWASEDCSDRAVWVEDACDFGLEIHFGEGSQTLWGGEIDNGERLAGWRRSQSQLNNEMEETGCRQLA